MILSQKLQYHHLLLKYITTRTGLSLKIKTILKATSISYICKYIGHQTRYYQEETNNITKLEVIIT